MNKVSLIISKTICFISLLFGINGANDKKLENHPKDSNIVKKESSTSIDDSLVNDNVEINKLNHNWSYHLIYFIILNKKKCELYVSIDSNEEDILPDC